MSLTYNIYSNDGAGGPIDYTAIVASVSGLTWTSAALSGPIDRSWAVRTLDTVSGLTEVNTDAFVRLVLDASSVNITSRPNAPTGLTARPGAASSVALTWQYAPGGQGGAPTGFHVYAGTPTPNYGTIVATVPYAVGRQAFHANVSGLTAGAPYQAVVRAYNATAEDPNAIAVPFTPASAGPLPVDSLSGSAVP